MYKLKNNFGFSLIEVLVAIVILGIIGTVAVNVISSTLRGSNKSNSMNNVRQNGNYIISQISKQIAYAEKFEGVSQDGIDYSTCTSLIPYTYLKIKLFDGTETTYFCDRTNRTINVVNSSITRSLIDTSKMSIANGGNDCNFYCNRTSAAQSPTIKISFILTTGATSAEGSSTIPFETSVKSRNN